MKRPDICAVITSNDLAAINEVETLVQLYEVRIDLIGKDWPEVAKQLSKPWIACNRAREEGGAWQGSEDQRLATLMMAAEVGATIIDVELRTNNLSSIVSMIKENSQCLLSYHNFAGTPPLDTMKEIIVMQLEAGADICKLVTTAHSLEDSLATLDLFPQFPNSKLVTFAMGDWGIISRILSPLAGGEFTYASLVRGSESAPGQITVKELNNIYHRVNK